MSISSIAVLGTGANGASIGADLIDAGLDPVFIEQWPAHVEAMRAEGLRVHTPSGTRHVHPRVLHLCEVATLRERFDLVLLVTKAYDARWASALIEPYLADDGAIAAVQNGMTTQTVADVVGPDRCVGTVIEISSTMTEPGIVHRHVDPERSWFAVDATAPRGPDVADVLSHAGEVARVDDIGSAKWMKLVSNASVLVPTAALGLPMVDAIRVPGMRELMLDAGREALRVAGEHRVLPIFGLTEASIAESDDVVDTMLDVLYSRFTVPGATTTVLQDWGKGRRSEVDDINGAVVAAGRRLGIPTPVNDAIVAVGHAIERGEFEPSLAALDRMRPA
ncbi:2-dehydropantoate 2-reductase [Microbacterium sp. KSW2-21]|uniref:2-dehydropantoate 2-reductase n=1 Tax=Microbacterium algihabitans TaxID=3075992 RepID=A0ABU3RZG4_9MICO|nr:2-dehydropantoate 2-reductase [Microbacterium sp. KSW2-21]MDU0328204.1 2-dehydropantoate 2-reductase [Microbacterium sp. KSW2-21]